MKKTILAALSASAVLLATPAIAKTYVCEITEQGKTGWIPEVVIVTHDEGSGAVSILDPLIKHYKGAPLDGKVAVRNSKRITVSWVLDKITNKHGGRRQFTAGLRYRITIQNASHKATIWAVPTGYSNQFRGKGSCEVRN